MISVKKADGSLPSDEAPFSIMSLFRSGKKISCRLCKEAQEPSFIQVARTIDVAGAARYLLRMKRIGCAVSAGSAPLLSCGGFWSWKGEKLAKRETLRSYSIELVVRMKAEFVFWNSSCHLPLR